MNAADRGSFVANLTRHLPQDEGAPGALRCPHQAGVPGVFMGMSWKSPSLADTPELLSRFGAPTFPEDLHRFPCALWAGAAKGRTGWRLGSTMIEPVAALVTNDYQHLRAIGESGDALVDLPPFLANDGLRSGRLVQVLPQHPMPSYTVMLIHPFHRHPSSVVKAYLDFCQANVRRYLAMDGGQDTFAT